MEAYQERVIKEKAELDAKLEKLDHFLAGEVAKTIPREERDRLVRQLGHMQSYADVLGERIKNFK